MAQVTVNVPSHHECCCSYQCCSTTLLCVLFSRPAPRVVGTRLPTITGEEDDISIARRFIKETQKKMTRKYCEVPNRKCKEQKVNPGVLVWIKREVKELGLCKKLCVKWNGPYQVVEVLRDGGGYVGSERPIYGTNVTKSG